MCKIVEDDREVVLDCIKSVGKYNSIRWAEVKTMQGVALLFLYDETYKNSSYGVGQALRYRLSPQFIGCGHECSADEFRPS